MRNSTKSRKDDRWKDLFGGDRTRRRVKKADKYRTDDIYKKYDFRKGGKRRTKRRR